MPNDTIDTVAIANDIAQKWNCTDSASVDMIAKGITLRHFHKNDLLYREGERPANALYLVSGKVKIVKECGIGRAQIVRAVKENTFLDYRAFFADEAYTTSAMAFEDSTVAELPLETVMVLMRRSSGIANYFLAELAVILGTTDSRIVSLTQKHIRGRLAETILDLKDNYGVETDGQTLNIAMNRDDLASMSNMSTSNAIRTLSSFAHEGILSIDGKQIKILDEEKLLKISELG